VGHYASYGRCVESTKISHGKRTGQGNGKNGHPYLGWASMEAPQFALRFHPSAQRFSQRTLAKSHNNTPLARKTVAHKLARACSYIMRDLVPFDAMKALG
jgi:transposase